MQVDSEVRRTRPERRGVREPDWKRYSRQLLQSSALPAGGNFARQELLTDFIRCVVARRQHRYLAVKAGGFHDS